MNGADQGPAFLLLIAAATIALTGIVAVLGIAGFIGAALINSVMG